MADVVTLIEHDHRAVEELFARFESGDTDVVATICEELDRHTAGEERAVYPVIASDVPGGKKMTNEAVDEHKEARNLIGRIRNTTDADHLRELVTELKTAVQHHVDEEEHEVLPAAQQALSQDRLEELGRDFEAAKQAATQSR